MSVYGFDSITFTEFAEQLNKQFGLDLSPTVFFEHLTIHSFAQHLCEAQRPALERHFQSKDQNPTDRPNPATEIGARPFSEPEIGARPFSEQVGARPFSGSEGPAKPTASDGEPIAIVGMAGILPQCPDLDSFWENLDQGRDLITEIPPDRWHWRDFHEPEITKNQGHRWGGFIPDMDRFDAAFFGISPREAMLMDPQQRIFLQTIWQTIENAGYTTATLASVKTGVFVGVTNFDFVDHLHRAGKVSDPYASLGIAHSVLANRISFHLNLTGPSEPLDTACSSSLVAIHRAINAIRAGDCHMALAGGVNTLLSPHWYRSLNRGGFLAHNGRCKSFAKGADGYVRSEGAGALLLKPLSKARADGDTIHGLIIGSGVNHGGRSASITAPNPSAQMELLRSVYQRAKIPPESISYLEAHGTGTGLGDPIEMESLKKAFASLATQPDLPPYCGVGSVKTHVGHLEAAAGMASIFKVILAMKHGRIPGNLHLDECNPYINLKNSPFFFVTENRAWLRSKTESGATLPRRAGISAFGFGGSNAHMILEEYPSQSLPPAVNGKDLLFPLSAKNQGQLTEVALRLADFLEPQKEWADARLGQIAYTLQVGREPMKTRLALTAKDASSLISKLRQATATSLPPGMYRSGGTTEKEAHKSPAQLLEWVQENRWDAVARAWARGVNWHWQALYGHEENENTPLISPGRIPLPTYPFAKTRFWPEPDENTVPQPSNPLPPQQGSAPMKVTEEVLEQQEQTGTPATHWVTAVEAEIRTMAAAITMLEEAHLDANINLGELGFDSFAFSELGERLSEWLDTEFDPTLFFTHSDLHGIAQHIAETYPEEMKRRYGNPVGRETTPIAKTPTTSPRSESEPVQKEKNPGTPFNSATEPGPSATMVRAQQQPTDSAVAIIGMSGRLPGSPDLNAFWDHLLAGDNLITRVPPDRWDTSGYGGQDPRRWGAFLEQLDCFDSLFFGISPREAQLMDPQQRLFLETTWKCIEDAGYSAGNLSGSNAGLFVGVGNTDYRDLVYQRGMEADPYQATGLSNALLANRISYLLDLHGPSEVVDAACAGSLVAVHRALEALLSGRCETAIAGGVSLILSPHAHGAMAQSGLLSADGKCRPFDRKAAGYVRGEGVAAVMLKPLQKALTDGDAIRAVILGGAVNHGGRAASLTAPNPKAQEDVVVAAFRHAGIDPNSVAYIEAAANGTELGDPLEIQALNKAFARLSPQTSPASERIQPCLVGNHKGNLGHLEPVSGIAGLIKLVQAMEHGTLPGNPNLEQPNTHLPKETRFQLIQGAQPWQPRLGDDGSPLPRRAGVSSFGFGGVNVHLVVEEAPPMPPEEPEPRTARLFLLSAKTQERLRAYAGEVANFVHQSIKQAKPLRLLDLAFTSQVGRKALEERLAVLAEDLAGLQKTLQDFHKNGAQTPGLCLGNGRREAKLKNLLQGEEGSQFIQLLLANGALEKLGELWVSGLDVRWLGLYQQGPKPRRIPMTTYPFARVRHWLEDLPDQNIQPVQIKPLKQSSVEAATLTPSPKTKTTQLEKLLLEEAARFLKLQPGVITPDTDLVNYGLDSFMAGRFINRLRERHGFEVPVSALMELTTLQQLARYLEREKKADQPGKKAAKVTGPTREFPLAEGQKALWFLHEMDPHTTAYHIPNVHKLAPHVDADHISKAVNALVAHHPALRTGFRTDGKKPTQTVHAHRPVQLNQEDCSGLNWSACLERVREKAFEPLDLEKDTLVRMHLFTRGPKDSLLLLVLHHIVFDGVSYPLFMADLAQAIRQLGEGKIPKLEGGGADYSQFVAWQRAMLQSSRGDRHWEFWKKNLAGELPILELPTDGQRQLDIPQKGAFSVVKLDQTLMTSLGMIARGQKASLFMVLMAAFKLLLFRTSRAKHLIVGTPTEGRPETRFENTIGYFVNAIPLRSSLEGNPRFKAFLAQIKQRTLQAFEHGHFPFSTMVERLNLKRENGIAPVFQTTFALQNWIRTTPDGPVHVSDQAPGLNLEPIPEIHQMGEFDLTLEILQTSKGWLAYFKFNGQLYHHDRINRLGNHYLNLLEGIVGDPGAPVYELPLMAAAERKRMLEGFNATGSSYPKHQTVHGLFMERAQAAPDRTALVYQNGLMSYGRLNEASDKLALILWARGARPETHIGIFLDGGIATIVAILGILKTGATYIPLDPGYPQERLDFMLRDSGIRILVSGSHMPPFGEALDRVEVDRLPREPVPENHILPSCSGGQLAYVMYTSGSTGRPKGVAVPHRGVVRLVMGSNYAHFGPDEVLLQASSFSFDVTSFEIWSPLLHGGKLVLFPPKALEQLHEIITNHKITTLWLTAQLFHLMVDLQLEALTGLDQMLAGGEALSPIHVRKFLEKATSTRLINGYGPTENTTFTSCAHLREDNLGPGTVPIGKPVSQTQIYVVDTYLNPVPVGIGGELVTGGDGLARCYINRPGKTAQVFVPNPFSGIAGDRLYKTGDLVSYRQDGTLDFLGRVDRQVKLRGFRIELGEIEHQINQLKGIENVLLRVMGETEKRLVAYLVTSRPIDLDWVRQSLEETLPEYMIPSVLMPIEQLPLNANGKVDTAALPDPFNQPDEKREPELNPAKNPVEDIISSLYSQVLGKPAVKPQDNFFELGGHSLLATQLVTRIRETLQIPLTLHTLFENPVLENLARKVEDQLKGASGESKPEVVVPITRRTGAPGAPLPLSFSQERLWFLEQLEPDSPNYNVPLAFRWEGVLDTVALAQSFKQLEMRHETLRTRFEERAGRPVQIVAAEGRAPFILIDFTGFSPGDENHLRLLNQDTHRPFQLDRDPLLRVSLYRLRPNLHILLMNMHHIIADGWSMETLYLELKAFYRAQQAQTKPDLPPLPVQYGDFAVWQRQNFADASLERQRDYWRQQLSGIPPYITLPLDKPRPEIQTFNGAVLGFRISNDLTRAAETLCLQKGFTLFMVTSAIYAHWLARISGQTDLCVGTPIANRTHSKLEGLIGFFVNTLVLRFQLNEQEQSFTQCLEHVRKMALGAYTHQDMPFEQLVEHLQPPRDLGRSPLFQVIFTFDTGRGGGVGEGLGLPGINHCLQRFDYRVAKFELTLNLTRDKNGLQGDLVYHTDLFLPETAKAMVASFQALFKALITHPEQPTATLLKKDITPFPKPLYDGLAPNNPRKTSISEGSGQGRQASRSEPDSGVTAPPVSQRPDPLEGILTDIWQELLSRKNLNRHDDFFAIGGHSLMAVRLVDKIRQQWGVTLPLSGLFKARTLAAMATLISSSMKRSPENAQKTKKSSRQKDASSLVEISPGGKGRPLFLVHPVGGNVLCYAGLSLYLGKNRPVYGLQSIGLMGTKSPLTEIPAMATLYLKEILRLQPKGPYLVAGWSLGGIIAFEMARQLRKQRKTVKLFMLDSVAPHLLNSGNQPEEADLLHWFAQDLAGLAGKPATLSKQDLAKLTGEQRFSKVLQEATGWLPENCDVEQIENLYRVFRANCHGVLQYKPGPTKGKVTLFRAEHPRENFPKHMGWKPFAKGKLQVIPITGDHYTMLHGEHLSKLAKRLAGLF